MAAGATSQQAADSPGNALVLREMQSEGILLVLPGLYAVSLVLFGVAGGMPTVERGFLPGILLLLLLAAVGALRRVHYLASAWSLVVGCAALDILVTSWSGIGAAVCLLAWPAALATLFIGTGAGLVTAAACTAWLLLWPAATMLPDPALRGVAVLSVWGAVAMIWLAVRPLWTTLQWSWSSYVQSRRLLEEARESRLQLKQALMDLAEANLQLTRLNELAQSLRRAAEDARRAKEQFVANVSHELRTPLNMILGFSEMILQNRSYGHLSAALRADLAVILRNSQHLSSLIDDVLDLSRIEAGQMALSRESVALNEIVHAAVAAITPLFKMRGLFLETQVPDDLVVYCDRTRIREVLLNLLSNAGRFTEQGGVRVCAWQEGSDVVVSVADTGPGIAAEDQGRLFQPFQQLDGSLRRRHGGTGLGLAISKDFVELHGGSMWLDSEKARGTTIFFRLPVEPPLPPVSAPSRWLDPSWEYRERLGRSGAQRTHARPRLVVVEAGSSLQRLLRRCVGDAEVVRVGTLTEAAQELASMPPQALVVNDPSMPEALQQVSQSGLLPEGVPALVCSIPGEHETAGALGVAGYLVKPVSRDSLLGALDRLGLVDGTVLLADDEPEAVRLYWRMLTGSGRRYRVLTATNGREAINILREQRPDAVVLDLIMPEMDGFQVLAAKREDATLRGIPVIVISARDPAGHPVVTSTVGIARRGGLSVPQLLACIEAITRPFSEAAWPVRPAPTADLPG